MIRALRFGWCICYAECGRPMGGGYQGADIASLLALLSIDEHLAVLSSTDSRSSGEIYHHDCTSLNFIMADVALVRTANIFRAQKSEFSAN